MKLAKDTIIRMVKQSKLPWGNIDIVILEIFLAITVDGSELESHTVMNMYQYHGQEQLSILGQILEEQPGKLKVRASSIQR